MTHSLKVLICDDSLLIRKKLTEALQNIQEASNGVKALAAI